MANFKLTQTGEQIQADLDLLDKNGATSGQVLMANGAGGASWQNAGGGLYYHRITLYFTPNDPDQNPENESIVAIFGLYSNRSEAFTFDTLCNYLSSFMGEMYGMYGLTVSGIFMDPIYNDYMYGNILFANVPSDGNIYLYYTYAAGQAMGMTSTVFDATSNFLDTVYPA